MILASDVGGTKCLLGLFRRTAGRLRCLRQEAFPSARYDSFEAIIDAFLAGAGRVRIRACAIGVAGPIVAGRSQVVNLRWPIDARRLARKLGLPAVTLLNDVEATAWGVRELPASQIVNLTPRVRGERGNAALIAAGTGLGMALLVWDGTRHLPSASEGGHQGFAPRDALEGELLGFLRARHGRVSVERLVSGPGLAAIYEFLLESGRGRSSRRFGERIAGAADPAAEIGTAGTRGEDPLAVRALDLFVSLYGAAAGDLALVAKATAGVWIGGGIAPRILPKLRGGAFVRAFRDKGRLTPLVSAIPLRVIVEPRTALLGAAAYAAH